MDAAEREAQAAAHRMNESSMGRFGEAVCASVLKNSGIHYVSLCRIEDNGAPRLSGNGSVLPDFDTFGQHLSAYLDAKAKTESVVWRKRNQERHGIDRRNYEHYQKVAAIARKNCGIFIVEFFSGETHEWTGSILVESFRELATPFYGESNQSHMVYWARKQFREIDRLTATQLFALAKGGKGDSYEIELNQIFAPVKQTALF